MPEAGYGTGEPSGWMALELDHGTADETRLRDTDLVDAIVEPPPTPAGTSEPGFEPDRPPF